MKQICFMLYFFILALPSLWGADELALNLWSGKLCDLPGYGKWQIAAKHGRVLAEGNGNIRFQIPALQAGSSLDAYLIINGKKQKLCFYSPRILRGISAVTYDLNLKCKKGLQSLGVNIEQKKESNIAFAGYMPESYSGKLLFVFTEKFGIFLYSKFNTLFAYPRTKDAINFFSKICPTSEISFLKRIN